MKYADVIVIGGGPAGSAAAIALRRNGKSVLLLEKEKTGHHKVCGEFLSGEVAHYLAALGIDAAEKGAVPIDRVNLVHGRTSASAPLPFEAHSLSRQAFDAALLNKAQEAGSEILHGVMVNTIRRDEEMWHVLWTGGEAKAGAVFLATGKHDLKGWKREYGRHADMIGFKMHYRLHSAQMTALRSQVEIVLFKGGYAGLEPIEDGLANLCLVVRKESFSQAGKNWDGLLQSLQDQAPHLAARLQDATPQWDRPLAIYGIPYGFVFQRRAGEAPGLYRLGDQMAVIPSFCGDGMAIALYTADLAVRCYLSENSALYHARAARELGPQIRTAALIMRILSFSVMQKIAVALCAIFPQILPLFARVTRLRAYRQIE